MLLSLFCGAGGLDLGFERAGYAIGLAFDLRRDSVASYNRNRTGAAVARCGDVRLLTLEELDRYYDLPFEPEGVIGGPPCQSFSRANSSPDDETDPRHTLPLAFADLVCTLNQRSPVRFFVLENVTGLCSPKHEHRFSELKARLAGAGFTVGEAVLNAKDFCTPQSRERLFLVGLNKILFGGRAWVPPMPTTTEADDLTVRGSIGKLPEPVLFRRGLDPGSFPVHPNHWCMMPRSEKFTRSGALRPGDGRNRSFKTLAWDQPSLTVAYGHREVHIHPGCKRRLSVYEALRLQGFPHDYVLEGSLSSQIVQVSEAVPPALAEGVAASVRSQTTADRKANEGWPFAGLAVAASGHHGSSAASHAR